MKQNYWLLGHALNVFSQCGEDGILAKIFEILDANRAATHPRFCVEFGAGDGVTHSNTRNLIINRGWRSLQIEPDPGRYSELFDLYHRNRSVAVKNRAVGWTAADGLDAILAELPEIMGGVDLVSVDVDGNDWYCWGAMKKTRPQVVVCEFNGTFPYWATYLQPADPAINRGCSLAALCTLGKVKGYELVAATHWNAVFVLRELFPLFEIADNSPWAMWPFSHQQTAIGQGYDGTLIPIGNSELIWHGERWDMAEWTQRIQVLAAERRKYTCKLKESEQK